MYAAVLSNNQMELLWEHLAFEAVHSLMSSGNKEQKKTKKTKLHVIV